MTDALMKLFEVLTLWLFFWPLLFAAFAIAASVLQSKPIITATISLACVGCISIAAFIVSAYLLLGRLSH